MSRARRSPWFKPVVALAIAIGITLAAWAGLSANVFFATQLRLSDALFPGPRPTRASSSSRSTIGASRGWASGRGIATCMRSWSTGCRQTARG